MQTQYIIVSSTTKQRFLQLQKEFIKQKPDYKTNQDFIIRQLMDKYEGDLQ